MLDNNDRLRRRGLRQRYQRVPPLDKEEAIALFEVVVRTKDEHCWREAQAAIKRVYGWRRNVKTVKGGVGVTLALLELELEASGLLLGLDDTQAARIAEASNYGYTPRQVRRLARWFIDWYREYKKQAHPRPIRFAG